MGQLLTVSRAARLIGVSRGALQKKIQDGELQSFEGKVDVAELTGVFPQAKVEDNAMLERIERIIETAFQRSKSEQVRQLLAPDLHTLAARVAALSRELSKTVQENKRLTGIVDEISTRLNAFDGAQDPGAGIAALRVWLSSVLEEDVVTDETDQLVAQDAVLRVMAAQVHLMPTGHEFLVEGNNSILDAALSAGLAMDYGCSNGNCGKCKARLISGELKQIRPHDYVMPAAETSQGYVLTCCHTPITDVVLQAHEADSEDEIPLQEITARVKKVEKLSDDLAILRLRTPRTDRLQFLAGQRVALAAEGIPAHEYSIASCPCDDMNLEFHIRRHSDVPFSEHVFETLRASVPVNVEGPHGHFVLNKESTRPIIFIAFDTGFAPIKSLIEHAMTLNAAEFTHLYWIGTQTEPLYLHNLCRTWTDAFDDFRYTPVRTSERGLAQSFNQLTDDYPDLSGFEVFVAGPEGSVALSRDALNRSHLPDTQLYTEVC